MIEWVATCYTGISSMTMWSALMGVKRKKDLNIPKDNSDFRRCYDMVEYGHVTLDELQVVKKQYSWFAPFVDNWKELSLYFFLLAEFLFSFSIFLLLLLLLPGHPDTKKEVKAIGKQGNFLAGILILVFFSLFLASCFLLPVLFLLLSFRLSFISIRILLFLNERFLIRRPVFDWLA